MPQFIDVLTPRQKDAILTAQLPTVDLDRAMEMLTFVPVEQTYGTVPPEVFGDSLVVFPVKTNKKSENAPRSIEVHDPAGVMFGTELPYYRITAGGYYANFPDTEENFKTRLNIARAQRPHAPRMNRQQQSMNDLIAELEAHGIEVPQDVLDRYLPAPAQESDEAAVEAVGEIENQLERELDTGADSGEDVVTDDAEIGTSDEAGWLDTDRNLLPPKVVRSRRRQTANPPEEVAAE